MAYKNCSEETMSWYKVGEHWKNETKEQLVHYYNLMGSMRTRTNVSVKAEIELKSPEEPMHFTCIEAGTSRHLTTLPGDLPTDFGLEQDEFTKDADTENANTLRRESYGTRSNLVVRSPDGRTLQSNRQMY